MVSLNILKRKKYVLYCKPDENTRQWEEVAVFDKPISLGEAKALYEDCHQLRLEEKTTDGKRIRIVWVEPPRRKPRQPTLNDLLLEAATLAKTVAAVRSVFEEAFGKAVNNPQQLISPGLVVIRDIVVGAAQLAKILKENPELREVIKLVATKQFSGLDQLIGGSNLASLTNIPKHVEEKVIQDTIQDMIDAENAPCAKNPEECEMNEA